MGRKYGKQILVVAAAVLGFFLPLLAQRVIPSQWEARMILQLRGISAAALPSLAGSAEFHAHLRELTAFSSGLSASPIPGTGLMTVTARADAPAHALGVLETAENQLQTFLNWIGPCEVERILTTEAAALPADGGANLCLASALAAGILAVLLLFPLARQEEPLVLSEILRRWLSLARRRLPALLMLIAVLGSGTFLLEQHRHVPRATASTLVSIGEYQPDTAKILCSTVTGLVSSDLMTIPGISATPVGQTNLFRLEAVDTTPEVAEIHLKEAMTLWPALGSYAYLPLPLTQHQPVTTTDPTGFSPMDSFGKGILLGCVIWASGLFLAALPRGNIDTAPSKAYNKSQS